MAAIAGTGPARRTQRRYIVVVAVVGLVLGGVFVLLGYWARCEAERGHPYVTPEGVMGALAVIFAGLLLIVGIAVSAWRRSRRVLFATLVASGAIVAGFLVGVGVGTALCTVPTPPPTEIAVAGSLTVHLGPGWDRRLDGPATCVRDRVSNTLVAIRSAGDSQWIADGWWELQVSIRFDDFRNSAPMPSGVEVVYLLGPNREFGYVVTDQSEFSFETDGGEYGGSMSFRGLVLHPGLDTYPTDDEFARDPPETLDMVAQWTCPPA